MLRTEQRGKAQDAELKTCHLKENEKEKKRDVLICGTQATQRAIHLTSIFCRVGAVGNAA